MQSSRESLLKQFSMKETWKTTSNRWNGKDKYSHVGESSMNQMEGFTMYVNEDNEMMVRKRVMVVINNTSYSKHAMMWALTHVTNKGDLLTLLHVVPPHKASESSCSANVVNYLGSLCRDCKPDVKVEALVIQGPKLATVMSQVKKLDVSVLVLGQKKPSSLLSCLCGNSSSSTEEFTEYCINNTECLTIGVRKRSKGMNGYLISTRWQKNFWLLA
ncbi:unnamed protein product [Lupinus luteus]|uniref:UspA domain-containing protein n=1 Tax=Lupinus luteus TaxID=3873 RepID=A0AAV1X9N7_LUPLU